MNGEYILYIGRRTLEVALMLSAPVLIVTMVLGFLSAMLQAVTSIRDMTMGTILKLVGVGLTLLVCGNWMLQVAMAFTVEVFNQVQTLGH